MRTKRWLIFTMMFALIAAACGGSDATVDTAACGVGETDGDLSFYNWAEYIDPDLITAFEAEYGIDVEYTEYESNEQMLAQIEAGAAVYDLVVPSDYMVDTMRLEDLLVELNFDAIPNAANIAPEWDKPPYDPDGKYSIPYQWGTTGIGISYDALGDQEPSWALIFDPEVSAQFNGRISMLDDAPEVISAALKYLGYSIVDVIEAQNEDAVREAGALIAATRDRLTKFDSVTYGEDLVNGEVDVAHGWSGGFAFAFDSADAWEDYVYVIPKEGGVRWVDTMGIPVTAEHPCSAQTMINFLLDAENGAQLTNWNFYASPNAASVAYIEAEILEDPGIYPTADIMPKLELIPNQGELALLFQDEFTRAKS